MNDTESLIFSEFSVITLSFSPFLSMTETTWKLELTHLSDLDLYSTIIKLNDTKLYRNCRSFLKTEDSLTTFNHFPPFKLSIEFRVMILRNDCSVYFIFLCMWKQRETVTLFSL